MHKRSFLSVGTWVGIALALWTVAWVIAESIPVFNDLLSLIVCLGRYPKSIVAFANRAFYIEFSLRELVLL